VSVLEQSGPIIANPQYLMSGGVSCKMSTDMAIMELLQNFVCVFTFEASQNYLIIINPEEYRIYEEIL
jgi:hypothetical protein